MCPATNQGGCWLPCLCGGLGLVYVAAGSALAGFLTWAIFCRVGWPQGMPSGRGHNVLTLFSARAYLTVGATGVTRRKHTLWLLRRTGPVDKALRSAE